MERERLRCNCCGRELYEGGLKYVVEVQTFADFDGYLDEHGDDVEQSINELLQTMEGMDQERLEEEVTSEHVYILCKTCRDRFIEDPFKAEHGCYDPLAAKGTVH